MSDTKNSKGWGSFCNFSKIFNFLYLALLLVSLLWIGIEEFSLYLYAIKIGYLWFFLTARYLSLGNLRDANYLMDEIKKQVSSKELEFPESELMQFIGYLLLT